MLFATVVVGPGVHFVSSDIELFFRFCLRTLLVLFWILPYTVSEHTQPSIRFGLDWIAFFAWPFLIVLLRIIFGFSTGLSLSFSYKILVTICSLISNSNLQNCKIGASVKNYSLFSFFVFYLKIYYVIVSFS